MDRFMKAAIEVIIGVILIILVVWFLITSSANGWGWWIAVLTCIKGGVAILVFLIGLALLFFGFSEIKE